MQTAGWSGGFFCSVEKRQKARCGQGSPALAGFRWRFLNGFLPSPALPGLGLADPAGGVERGGFERGGGGTESMRLPGAREISSSWSSSHWDSVRNRSGMACSSCRRRRGGTVCGAFMAALSHCRVEVAHGKHRKEGADSAWPPQEEAFFAGAGEKPKARQPAIPSLFRVSILRP